MSQAIQKILCGLALSYIAMNTYAAVELIDQGKVMASGGFPYKIKKPGSYRLSSNLTVTGSKDGIHIEASNVTIDLDGFAMIADTGGPFVGGAAISDNNNYIGQVVVRNGTFTNWNANVYLPDCSPCTVKDLNIGGGNSGITVGSTSVVSGNVVTGGSGVYATLQAGIVAGSGSTVTANTSTGWTLGMSIGSNSLVSGNSVYQNFGGGGIVVACPADLIGNIVRDNAGQTSPANIIPSGSGCTYFNDNAP